MAPLALQTSDLISDISAVIATGTSLHPATSSASAGYFCWEVAETWQAQRQRKPMAASSALWARCVSRLSPNPRAPYRLHSAAARSLAPSLPVSLSVCGHLSFTSHIHFLLALLHSGPSYREEQPQSQLYDTVHHGRVPCILSGQTLPCSLLCALRIGGCRTWFSPVEMREY